MGASGTRHARPRGSGDGGRESCNDSIANVSPLTFFSLDARADLLSHGTTFRSSTPQALARLSPEVWPEASRP